MLNQKEQGAGEWCFFLDMRAKPPKLMMKRDLCGTGELREPTESEKLEYLDANAW